MKASYVRALLLTAMAIVLAVMIYHVDWHTTGTYLRRLGPSALLGLLPYAFVLGCDTLGWLWSFEQQGLSFWPLWKVRAITEAMANSMPGGIAVGDTLKAVLLKRIFGLPLPEAAANVIVTKFTIGLAHVVFLVAGFFVDTSLFDQLGRPGLTSAYMLSLVVLLLMVVATAKISLSNSVSRLIGVLLRVAPGSSLLARLIEPAADLDRSLSSVGRMPRGRLLKSTFGFLLGWFALSVETWAILWLITPDVTLAQAIAMEAIVSIVRMVFFFVPGGVGPQDLSYYALLNMWGVPHAEAIAPAFTVIKRTKELCWIGLGYLLLGVRPAAVAQSETQSAEEQSSRQKPVAI